MFLADCRSLVNFPANSVSPLPQDSPQKPVAREVVLRNDVGVMKSVLLEAVLVVLCGGLFALLANQISPRGLRLTRNYFPAIQPHASANPVAGPSNSKSQPDAVPSDEQLLAERLRENGLQLMEYAQLQAILHAGPIEQASVLLIDARDEETYQSGHIPGAYEFDPYRPEKQLPSLLPLCEAAQRIVLYCHGGDCEDSEFAALSLREAGVVGPKLFVYGGGITEWTNRGEPVEKGRLHGAKVAQVKP